MKLTLKKPWSKRCADRRLRRMQMKVNFTNAWQACGKYSSPPQTQHVTAAINNHLLQNRRGTDTQTRRAGGAHYVCCHLNPFQLEITVIKGHLMSRRCQRRGTCWPSRSAHISDVKPWWWSWRWTTSCCRRSHQYRGKEGCWGAAAPCWGEAGPQKCINNVWAHSIYCCGS